MNITQTKAFIQDTEHYTNIAKEWMHTTRKQEIKNSIHRLEKLRGKDYVNKLVAKCNQKLKVAFYEKIA